MNWKKKHWQKKGLYKSAFSIAIPRLHVINCQDHNEQRVRLSKKFKTLPIWPDPNFSDIQNSRFGKVRSDPNLNFDFCDTLEYVVGQPTKNMNKKDIHSSAYVLSDSNIKCTYKKNEIRSAKKLWTKAMILHKKV